MSLVPHKEARNGFTRLFTKPFIAIARNSIHRSNTCHWTPFSQLVIRPFPSSKLMNTSIIPRDHSRTLQIQQHTKKAHHQVSPRTNITTKTQHCRGPKIHKLKGNCRPGPKGSCATHQILCPTIINGQVCGKKHLKIERCPTCGR